VILPDVNVLIYAFYEHADRHQVYASWLNAVRSEEEELLLPDTVLLGFLRIVTSPRIYQDPAPMAAGLAFTSALRRGRRARVVEDNGSVWSALERLSADDRHIKGNLVPDAYLAAVAISHKAQVATRDRGFSRFPGLRWFDPGATKT
jgi:toxin-antitoxin system PIN domain toxin